MDSLARYLDPGRSLAAAIGWVVLALSIGIALVATASVGDIVRSNLLDQRGRQLDRTAERIAAELNLNIALRLQSVRALAAVLTTELGDTDRTGLRKSLDNLQRAYPEFEWIGATDRHGRILATTQGVLEGTRVGDRAWFAQGMKGSGSGVVRRAPTMGTAAGSPATSGVPEPVADLIAPLIDVKGNSVGVIAAQLGERWLLGVAGNLLEELRGSTGTQALLLDHDDTIMIGPAALQGKRWQSTLDSAEAAMSEPAVDSPRAGLDWRPHVERLVNGERILVARAMPASSDVLHALGWQVIVLQPLHDATRRARLLQGQIAAILLGLGLLAAIGGALLARRLTRDLEAIAMSADAVRAGTAQGIVVPPGRSEAARLGRALDELLGSLRHERNALQALNAELDERVAARTREIERLADHERYAAVVRERLRIARDLHDTLAHSMMAMLTEIRLLKRLSATDPAALSEELVRAEEAAHQGLKDARDAIAQMRFNPVRDEGLSAALGDFVKAFVERTGIPVDYDSDVPAGTFADERAEVLFRIVEEAMHNIERHAGASQVTVSLHVSAHGRGVNMTVTDDGVGFDADAAFPGHYGLAGLREQAHLIGAVLTVRSAPRQGTTISVVWEPSLGA